LEASVIGAKSLERIVGERPVDQRIENEGDIHGGEQGVAVRDHPGNARRGDGGIGPGLVLDDDGGGPVLAHALRDDAAEDVGRARGRKRHDDVDGAMGEAIRAIWRGRASGEQHR